MSVFGPELHPGNNEEFSPVAQTGPPGSAPAQELTRSPLQRQGGAASGNKAYATENGDQTLAISKF